MMMQVKVVFLELDEVEEVTVSIFLFCSASGAYSALRVHSYDILTHNTTQHKHAFLVHNMCSACGQSYALPDGATSWRCGCGHFNSLTEDECPCCTIM